MDLIDKWLLFFERKTPAESEISNCWKLFMRFGIHDKHTEIEKKLTHTD